MNAATNEIINFSEHSKPKYESEDLKELYTALAKAQEEMESAKLDSKNPFFKSTYADLPSVIKASRPFLAKNGLAVMQRVMTNVNNTIYLSTRLCHSSGQWIESSMPIDPPKKTIQDIGSYITYVRRYTYSALIGVVGSDDDDDGEAAMVRSNKISKSQLEILSSYTKKLPMEKVHALLDYYQISKIQDLTSDKFEGALKKLKATVEALNENN